MTRFNEMSRPATIPTSAAAAAPTTAITAIRPSTPNPNLRPLIKGPFYAVKMVLSDLGTCGGLRADDRARVLREDGSAIDGLYAIGNTAANAFGTTYPGCGRDDRAGTGVRLHRRAGRGVELITGARR